MSLQVILILVILHVLAGVFWAGSTFAAAGDTSGQWAPRLFRAQMAAAIVAIVAGGILMTVPESPRAAMAQGIGALAAILAAGVQGAMVGAPARKLAAATAGGGSVDASAPLRGRIVYGNRLASVLLAVTVACMAASMHL